MAIGAAIEVTVTTSYHSINDKLDAVTRMQEQVKYLDERLRIVEAWKERVLDVDGWPEKKKLRSPKDEGKNPNEP